MWRVETFSDEAAVIAVLLIVSLAVFAVIAGIGWLARRRRQRTTP
jgi:hypothetical protein